MTDLLNTQEQSAQKREHVTIHEQELIVESITLKQFAQSIMEQEGIPVGIAYPVREPIPGQELARHRVRVSFDFDVTCNDEPVRSMNDVTNSAMSTALLKSFLVANKTKLLDIMVEKIASELGWHPEAFLSQFLPQVDTNSQVLFKPAIEVLEGDEKQYWHEQEAETDNGLSDWFDYCVEEIFKCFQATFISSTYEILE